jgi:hypothetical protein
MQIHTIGDSHCRFALYGIIQYHIGPVLCYSFGKEKLARCDIRNFNINNSDTIIFSLGEIDCRCHVKKHITDTVSFQHIIDNIVNNYFDAIELNITISQINFKNICVYNIVPPIQKYNTFEDPQYPYVGSDEERQQYAVYFNQKLKEKCIEKGYVFFDIYNKYADENGFLRKDLSDGYVHINNGTYITEFINEHLL